MNDVVVVGAGPAGNNAAYRLASMGYGVAVVDWRTRIGDKLCTGIVGRECIQRFPLDRSIVFKDASSARAVAPGGETVDIRRQDVQAHVVDRVAYVGSFAERAQEAGATYMLGYRVTDVSCDGEYASVQLSNNRGGEQQTVTARSLVLASGFGSELAGQLGLGKVGDFVTGFQAEVLAPDIDQIHIYLGQDIAPGFFGWMVPTSGGRALVGLLGRHHGQLNIENLILRLRSEGKITAVTKEPARWGIPLRPLARTFGDRLLVVGDAAGQVKPTTGGGIYYALLASEIAADCLHEAFSRNDLSAHRLSSYEKGWKALLSSELEVGYSARRLFEILEDCQLDLLIHTVASNGTYKELIESQDLSFDWHSRLILKALDIPILRKAFAFINPLLAGFASRQ